MASNEKSSESNVANQLGSSFDVRYRRYALLTDDERNEHKHAYELATFSASAAAPLSAENAPLIDLPIAQFGFLV